MDHTVHCENVSPAVHVVLTALSVLQSIAIAWLSQRAIRRDRREVRSNGNGGTDR